MPSAPPRPCSWPGCPKLQPCDVHKRKAHDVERRSEHQRLYGYRWQRARKRFIEQNPLCKPCEEAGRFTPTFAVDHRTPHRGNAALFWDEQNWDPLCESHHNAKSRSERLT